jgi:hypothetical protein
VFNPWAYFLRFRGVSGRYEGLMDFVGLCQTLSSFYGCGGLPRVATGGRLGMIADLMIGYWSHSSDGTMGCALWLGTQDDSQR